MAVSLHPAIDFLPCPHEVPVRNGLLLFRLFQSGAGVFEVQAIHLLLGQALEKVEVINGNHGGHVLPTAGNNSPLLPVGGAVYDFGTLLPRFRDLEACHRMYLSYNSYEDMTSIGQLASFRKLLAALLMARKG